VSSPCPVFVTKFPEYGIINISFISLNIQKPEGRPTDIQVFSLENAGATVKELLVDMKTMVIQKFIGEKIFIISSYTHYCSKFVFLSDADCYFPNFF
jgi:hypothetical protein